jgi:hypothetical protein
MGSFRVGVVLGAVLLLAATGCASQEPGAPVPVGSTSTTSTTTSAPTTGRTTTTTSSKPPVSRPKPIDVSGTDGCKIIKQLPATEFGIQDREPRQTGSLIFKGFTDCSITNADTDVYLSITTETSTDMEDYACCVQGTATRTTVAGYPAFTHPVPGAGLQCLSGVSVSDGQMLFVSRGTGRPNSKQEPVKLCETALQAATAAMKVLGAS